MTTRSSDAANQRANQIPEASGDFVVRKGERWYVIRDYDAMPPFFCTIISDSDHWMFISSSGGLTAGRVSPETALFPYVTVDRIHESHPHTGSKTIVRVGNEGQQTLWEPFNPEHDDRFSTSRNLYKTLVGNKICFEEINHDLQLAFRYSWCNSDPYGFVRECELENLSDQPVALDLLDGLQNLLPAGTPKVSQDMTSNLLDAYKWSELHEATGLGVFTLFSALSDRAEPAESLRATTAFCLGVRPAAVLLSSNQLSEFRHGGALTSEARKRGIRGAYLVNLSETLGGRQMLAWQIVCGMEQSQGDVVDLSRRLEDADAVARDIDASIEHGGQALARIMARSDGLQVTGEETVSAHHYANVIFNVLRGGIFDDQYTLHRDQLCASIQHFNRDVFARNADFLGQLPEQILQPDLMAQLAEHKDAQLERLCLEYLPITFGRRHGDPSRPWNMFSIRVRDADGEKLLSYEGNWRDIFQNWEGLALGYPEFVESMIAKFVNASTMDGYNPYRITSEGIDWEIEDPDDPWSYIGYWGDHQIIYLQKLLELSRSHHPRKLYQMLHRPIFAYANVPYRLRSFEQLLVDSKSTVSYDSEAAAVIAERVRELGADGKLVLDSQGKVALVSLMEKLLVPLLAKLGNLVADGGIWMNTQRPEWNDANNALVGNGLSMVTLYYLRRYLVMLTDLVAGEEGVYELSAPVADWLRGTSDILQSHKAAKTPDDSSRFTLLRSLGEAASAYREGVYAPLPLSDKASVDAAELQALLSAALQITDDSIRNNRREDGLYHAYNLLRLEPRQAHIETLYAMLEGQVAVISSGALNSSQTIAVLDALFASDVYRHDQKTFMLYPDRPVPGFFEKNQVDAEAAMSVPVLRNALESADSRIVYRDGDGTCRFNADFRNVGDLRAALDAIAEEAAVPSDEYQAIEALYEQTFNHRAFTGRSGGMFGFEGLGSIYWHMVSKLLLAVQEAYYGALDRGDDAASTARLAELYYRVREGIGFNKTPTEYGAFPMDPYSHTPGHAGAQQPGMTGQVKEELLSRMGELGLRVKDGQASFRPTLLREQEFLAAPSSFTYLDVSGSWQTLALPARSLAFTWCQVPCVYELAESQASTLSLTLDDGESLEFDESRLPADLSAEIFGRTGRVRQLTLRLAKAGLYSSS